MFEAKKLKKLFEKKRKEKRRVFFCLFSSQKKILFHSHNTQTSNQIPLHSHSSHERHTHIFIIII